MFYLLFFASANKLQEGVHSREINFRMKNGNQIDKLILTKKNKKKKKKTKTRKHENSNFHC